MSLDLIIPPTVEPVTLAELKEHLRVLHTDEDALIASYGFAARRAVEARGGLALMMQQWRLRLDRAPTGMIALPRGPAFSVDAVAIESRAGALTPVDPDLYDFDPGPVGRLVARGYWPHSDRRIAGVRIDFTAGWATPADAPEELRLAVKLLAAHFYENRENASAERLFATPQAVDALIGPWKQVRL